MAAALARAWPYTQEMFARDAVDAAAEAGGLGPARDALAAEWQRQVAAVFNAARLLLPAVTRRRGSVPAEEWPLLAFAAWPLLFYPLLQLEPRMLFPVVIGTCIFGAAALVAAGTFITPRVRKPALQWVPATLAILALLPLLPVLARHTEAERGFHREVGVWLAANVGPEVTVTGDGYGYLAASGFWAGRRAQPRLWTDDSAALSDWVDARSPGVRREGLTRRNPCQIDPGVPYRDLTTPPTQAKRAAKAPSSAPERSR